MRTMNASNPAAAHWSGMFDCHAHLTDSSLRDGLDERLAEAEAAGVTGIVTVSESLEDANQVLVLLWIAVLGLSIFSRYCTVLQLWSYNQHVVVNDCRVGTMHCFIDV